jgi:hypothetical protein
VVVALRVFQGQRVNLQEKYDYPTSLWSLDTAIVADMTVVFGLIGRLHRYPDSMGYEAEFKAVVRAWRPGLED